MGIIFMFIAVLLAAYTFLLSRLLNFLLQLLLNRWLHLAIAPNILWSLVCVAMIPFPIYFLYRMLLSAKAGTPDMSLVWKFLMGLAVFLSVFSWQLGLK